MPKLKTIRTTTSVNNLVDPETGELVDQKVTEKKDVIVVDSENQFIQVYASLQYAIKGIPPMESRVMVELLFMLGKDNIIAITKPIRELMAKNINNSEGTIRNSLYRLVKLGILFPEGRSTYRFNPEYAWKGKLSDRMKSIRYNLEIKYEKKS